MRISTKKIAGLAVFTAISLVLSMPGLSFPIIPAAPYLMMDFIDVPIFIATLAYGPISGLIITVISSTFQALVTAPGTMPWGWLMHIVATGSFVLIIGIAYKIKKTKLSLLVSMIIGVIVWIGLMLLMNYLITPIYTGLPREEVVKMLIPVIMPFNAIKSAVNGSITFILYCMLEKIIRAHAGGK